MNTMSKDKLVARAEYIEQNARINAERTGQVLFADLRPQVSDAVRESNFDPFEENLTVGEIVQWYEDHVVFNKRGDMIALKENGRIIWREDSDG